MVSTSKTKKLLIGAAISTVFLMAAFLPLIPFAFSLSSTSTSSQCGTDTWLPLAIGGPASSWLMFKNISLGLSFAFQSRQANFEQAPRPNGTIHTWTSYTNQTLSFDIKELTVAHNNGTVASFLFKSFLNGTVDSYVDLYGASLTTHRFNSTALRATLFVKHVDMLVSKSLQTTALPSGVPISFDNFTITEYLPCGTGPISTYYVSGTTNGLTVMGILAGQHRWGMLASPLFFLA